MPVLPWMERAAIAAALALVIALLCAGPASARTLPFGFQGVMYDHSVKNAPADVQDAQWDLMAESGVESVRTTFSWAEAQDKRGAPFDFKETDALVGRAAQRNIRLLPVVIYTPAWARAYRGRGMSPPRRPSSYTAYLAALIFRYGPNGTYWSENPLVPKRPLREWQIWNEPHLTAYWDVPARSRFAHPKGYGALLRASYRTIKREDRGAKVVMAGITQRAWEELEEMYAHGGIKGYFDVASLQTFPQTIPRAVRVTKLFRAELRRRHDGRKPIYITEITWPASKGRTKGIKFQRQETDRGMAGKLAGAMTKLAKERRSLGLARVYWYTWASPYGHGGSIFDYAGLLQYNGDKFKARPALAAFQRVARRYQGCRKDKTGACS
jgi:hypothetical protein